ncbi:19180_t:CDS:2 [Dentiscutata erythropus]|uniref:19180_t:CDS:1 n=1 Tax=Dentiscutata erythropus TaxID=1348616 RepID=A0A9N8Z8N3_9GLOM|nr:19180_t:CDS:2 [Dentiscutata erythropus]
MATPPPFPLLPSSHPISVYTTPPAPTVVPPPPPRHSVYTSDPRAHLISDNNAPSNFYFQIKGFENQFPVSGRNGCNILPPINTSTQLVNGFSTSVNGMHISDSMFVSSHHGRHLANRPRLELRRSSEPNYPVMEYDTIDSPPLPRSVYSSPISTGGFVFTQDRQQQPQLEMPQKYSSDLRLSTSITNQPFNQSTHACRRTSTLSKILQTTDDDQLNSKRMRFDRREDGNRDNEDGDSSGSCSNGCQESGISLSPLRIAPISNPMSTSSNGSPVTTNSSDTGSMLGEQVPQQQILRQNKGLRHFSKQVCDKVELKGVTTYNEVADELSEDFAAHMQEHGGQKVDQKNIRRRVYDALNVLMAMDIIAKDKKEIRWLGLPGQKNNTNLASSSATTEAEIERQKSEIRILEQQNRRLSKQVDEAKVAFQYKIASHLHIRNLVKRNKQRHDPYKVTNKVKSEKLYLPFKLIRCPRGTVFNNQTGEDGILEDVHILQYIGMDKITPEDMQQWVSPEHLKWIITKQGEDGDYRISYEQ